MDQAAFQGEKPQAYWLQVKVFQHRNAAIDAKNALQGFYKHTLECVYKSWEMQLRGDLPAFQGAFPQA